MSYDENRISDLIDGGLKHQEESIRIDYDQYGLIMTDTFRYFIRKISSISKCKNSSNLQYRYHGISRYQMESRC